MLFTQRDERAEESRKGPDKNCKGKTRVEVIHTEMRRDRTALVFYIAIALWLAMMAISIINLIGCNRWEDNINNEANKDYIVEVAFNLGISPDQVTQQQFNNRYLTNR